MSDGKISEEHLYPSLEGLRFVASIGIILSHYMLYFDGTGLDISYLASKFHLFVDLFFVISGFVIALVYTGKITDGASYGQFIQRRLARLYPLHLATLLFYVFVGWLAMRGVLDVVNDDKYDFSALLPNLLLVHSWGFAKRLTFNYVSWSISAEMFVYLLFPAILWAVSRRMAAGLALVLLAFLAATALSEFVLKATLTGLNVNFSIIRALPSFGLGVWMFLNVDRLQRLLPSRWVASIFHLLLGSLVVLMLLRANEYLILVCAWGVVLSAVIADRSKRMTVTAWAPVSLLGQLTYSSYMLHTLVATIGLSFLFPRLIGTTPLATFVSVLLSIVLTLVISVLSYRFFELPMRRRINRWGWSRRLVASKA